MKRLVTVAAVCLVSVLAAQSYAQTGLGEGYTFIRGTKGLQICQGRWVPSSDVALPGVCQGELEDADVFNAVSSRMTAARLDQLLTVLSSVDRRLAVSNEQLNRLIETIEASQASAGRQVSDLIEETLTRRLNSLPAEMLANEAFREELRRMRDDIVRDIEAGTSPQPATR